MRFKVCSLSRALWLALAALFCLSPLSLRSSASAQTFDRIERERARDMLSAVKDDIKKNYYDATFRGIDVDARFKAADEKMKQATSLGQSLGIIAQALLDFNDSHLFFAPPARPASRAASRSRSCSRTWRAGPRRSTTSSTRPASPRSSPALSAERPQLPATASGTR